MSDLNFLLDRNRNRADGIKQADHQFRKKLSEQQSPQYLWIGCSGSRESANQIV